MTLESKRLGANSNVEPGLNSEVEVGIWFLDVFDSEVLIGIRLFKFRPRTVLFILFGETTGILGRQVTLMGNLQSSVGEISFSYVRDIFSKPKVAFMVALFGEQDLNGSTNHD